MREKSQLFKLSFPAPEHVGLLLASGKELLSSFNPLLALAQSQDHPQKGLWERAVFPWLFPQRWSQRDGGEHKLGSLSALGDRKKWGKVGKEAGPWVGTYSDDI